MYDWPEVSWANDTLWAAIAGRLRAASIDAPASLDRASALERVWMSPGLVLSQTCGYPCVTSLRESVQVVAVPVYAVEGCTGANYSSLIVVRADAPKDWPSELGGQRLAFNNPDSLSGCVSLREYLLRKGLSLEGVEWIETGSHRASLNAIAAGKADIAAIDAVCWRLAQLYEPAAVRRLRVIDRTLSRGAPPFITAAHRSATEVAAIRSALLEALTMPETAAARETLRLSGAQVLSDEDYFCTLQLPAAA
jgi:ABC-type phosphate/phosphonate transport system substrate-binding protein